VLPTAGGLSIFARDVTEERRRARLSASGRDVVAAVAGPAGMADALRSALEALVAGWPLDRRPAGRRGWRRRSSAATSAVIGRRVRLGCPGRRSGTASCSARLARWTDDLLQLIALRMAAGRPPTSPRTRRAGRAEPGTGLVRSAGHGPDAS
jgi:hypothetical protein